MSTDTSEKGLETIIVDYLRDVNGYDQGQSSDFDPALGLDTARLEAFLFATQRKKVEQSGIFSSPSKKKAFFERVRDKISQRGVLDVLNKGIQHGTHTFTLYYPVPDAANEEAKRQYAENRFCVIRQLHFSNKKPKDSIDVAIFINGLPIITMELKNNLTKQDVDHAVKQYQTDRNPKELLFAPKRCAVHFAVDDQEVKMCAELRGEKSWFLPFNKGLKNPDDPLGRDDGAGNPVNPNGLKTDYLWHNILEKRQLSRIIEQFAQVVTEIDEETGISTEKCIWPRYHQLDVVQRLVTDSLDPATGKKFLIQHSAGSGKSNSITWLAFSLSNIKRADGSPQFDSILVVTDRVNLDRQIRNNILAFVDNASIVGWADKSQTLKSELKAGKKIIITTVHKFPIIMKTIGTELRNRRFAIIIDEAHSSQSGSMATDLNRVLSGLGCQKVKIEDNEDGLNVYLQEVVEGKKMAPNANFYAFTATPKNKTLEAFGTPYVDDEGETRFRPYHNYSMKQAIEEGFILDVLKNYTTYQSFYRIKKAAVDDPEFEKNQSQKKLRYWVESRPETVAKKAEIMVGHFHDKVAPVLGGQARAMIVTAGVERAIDFYNEVKKLLKQRNSPYKAIIAFSGDKKLGTLTVNEAYFNKFPSSKIEKEFRTGDYRFLIVADKFQTGYDEPLLCAMYVDKPLKDVKTVQTLSRLNRAKPGKKTFILDFVNNAEDIQADFQRYYRTTLLSGETDPNKLNDLVEIVEDAHIYSDAQLNDFNKKFWEGADRDKLDPILDQSAELFKAIPSDDTKIAVKSAMKKFVRTYEFLVTILPSASVEWQKRSTFYRFLLGKLPKLQQEDWTEGLIEAVSYQSYRSQNQGTIDITLDNENTTIDPVPTATAKVGIPPIEMERVSVIVDLFNSVLGNFDFKDEDLVRLQFDKVVDAVTTDDTVIDAVINNDQDVAFQSVENATIQAFAQVAEASNELATKFWQNQDNLQSNIYHAIFNQIMDKVNPSYDEIDLIKKMKADLEADFANFCGKCYRELNEVLNVFFKTVNAETTDNLDGLNNSLRRTLNFIYRAENSRDEDRRDRFRTLVTQYEAFLRKLYYLREGKEFVCDKSSGFVEIAKQFPDLKKLYNNQNPKNAPFNQYYQMVYDWRNMDSHTAPKLPEAELPAAIHIIVAMYVYATMVSVTDLEMGGNIDLDIPGNIIKPDIKFYLWEAKDAAESRGKFNESLLVGACVGPEHLEWIAKNGIYNIRAFGDRKGAIIPTESQTNSVSHLLLYNLENPSQYWYFEVASEVKFANAAVMKTLGYPRDMEPENQYFLYSLTKQLDAPEIDPMKLVAQFQPEVYYPGAPVFIPKDKSPIK
ncbi:MAG: DEAD/DEAH box helicase family protein [Bacteroidales bacterium]|nr:DEAD/DEAH box helicase family protein [Bacteroidales bacterium]